MGKENPSVSGLMKSSLDFARTTVTADGLVRVHSTMYDVFMTCGTGALDSGASPRLENREAATGAEQTVTQDRRLISMSIECDGGSGTTSHDEFAVVLTTS